jgi:predicted phage gp36 major capsid-like protein
MDAEWKLTALELENVLLRKITQEQEEKYVELRKELEALREENKKLRAELEDQYKIGMQIQGKLDVAIGFITDVSAKRKLDSHAPAYVLYSYEDMIVDAKGILEKLGVDK